MEGNDISFGSPITQATVFEGVIASPPATSPRYLLSKARSDWEATIRLWKPNDKPFRSMVDCVNRLRIGTDVITFLHQEAEEPIYQWLVRKGVSTTVLWYPSIYEYKEEVQYNMGLKVVYVADQEDAKILGMKAKVVGPTTTWSM